MLVYSESSSVYEQDEWFFIEIRLFLNEIEMYDNLRSYQFSDLSHSRPDTFDQVL
jgi:hypothetical protein